MRKLCCGREMNWREMNCPSCGRAGCCCYRACFCGSSLVLLVDGTRRPASDISVGDDLRAADGTVCKLLARTLESHTADLPHSCVKFGTLVITARHPVQVEGKWMRPADLPDGKLVPFVGELMNFVTEPRAALVIDNVAVSTLGYFCAGLDDEQTFYGSEKVVDELRKDPAWPSICKGQKASTSCKHIGGRGGGG